MCLPWNLTSRHQKTKTRNSFLIREYANPWVYGSSLSNQAPAVRHWTTLMVWHGSAQHNTGIATGAQPIQRDSPFQLEMFQMTAIFRYSSSKCVHKSLQRWIRELERWDTLAWGKIRKTTFFNLQISHLLEAKLISDHDPRSRHISLLSRADILMICIKGECYNK